MPPVIDNLKSSFTSAVFAAELVKTGSLKVTCSEVLVAAILTLDISGATSLAPSALLNILV